MLHRDGTPVLEWDIEDRSIVHPATAAGRSIVQSFREWLDGLDAAAAEHVYVMRRAVFVGLGRKILMTEPHIADDMPVAAVCHNYQPEQRKTSVRLLESIRRFNAGPQGMLSRVDTKP
jgi:hypothetical protein